jgi:uncharacterized YccA/Bax inhibitor family protein
MALRSGNPALNANTFSSITYTGDRSDVMTLSGTVNKAAILLFLVIIPASFVWSLFFRGGESAALIYPFLIGGSLGGFVVAIITVLKKEFSPVTAPIYAVLEGLCIGGISAVFEAGYPGIVIQAVSLTFGTLFVMLLAYKSGLIKATENFKLGIVAATGAIALVYIVSIVLGLFGLSIPLIHQSGPVGILFSLVVVTIAALNLVLDFDFIESGAEQGAPKYMEWYGAFGLMVTLIWLYLEILRLLAKLRRRD